MKKEYSEFKFDKEEFAKLKEQLKDAKKEYGKNNANNENSKKQSIGHTILGIIIILLLIGMVIFIFIKDIGTILLPKNSIDITISDSDGNAINGLEITLQSKNAFYDISFEDINSELILDAKPGNYQVIINKIPNGYNCPSFEKFTLKENGKVKLKYECTKES